jgi:hypothetical protein
MNTSMGNITREVAVSVASVDFTDENGFFIRSGVGGAIKYCPLDNKTDAEAITKTIDASALFNDPVICRKIFKTGTAATSIYVGYGV